MKLSALSIVVVLLLFSCHKTVDKQQNNPHLGGLIEDSPQSLANAVHFKSYYFSNDARVDGGSKKDTDKDGIVDSKDACPTQKEIFNGYLDEDGCPDVVPPPVDNDSDDDGIPNDQDDCPTQPETYNGFQDDDGCPDTPVIIIPPTPIPTSFELATPPIGNQTNEGSCAAFACTYAARTIEYYYKTNATNYDFAVNIFSPEYTYNQTVFWDCGSGTAIGAVMNVMIEQGVSTFAVMPYSGDNGCTIQPDNAQRANAASYKISSYGILSNTDHTGIKTMIANKHPVVAIIIADNSFINAGPGFVWRSYSGSGTLPHALVICGYDDSKNAYKVMNSWGTAWGDAGYSWIDYDFFLEKSGYNTFVIIE